jgi:hypothetical protein
LKKGKISWREQIKNPEIERGTNMAKSRYEKYVVRKPAVVNYMTYTDEMSAGDKLPVLSPIDTGPRVIISKKLVPSANTIVEYGFISGNLTMGQAKSSEDFESHRHDYEEVFLFLGTNPHDTTDLGAEIEFWLGEGKERDKVVLTTSSAVYVPGGLVHFPLTYRNVKRPVMQVTIMPSAGKRDIKPINK